mmetsp:Transcript_12883/g.47685  ORF Transcript_12883/g.47685 Transcript_12883/m.47685 type:complete len:245 (+) Transcript_12883:1409-2143(+)
MLRLKPLLGLLQLSCSTLLDLGKLTPKAGHLCISLCVSALSRFFEVTLFLLGLRVAILKSLLQRCLLFSKDFISALGVLKALLCSLEALAHVASKLFRFLLGNGLNLCDILLGLRLLSDKRSLDVVHGPQQLFYPGLGRLLLAIHLSNRRGHSRDGLLLPRRVQLRLVFDSPLQIPILLLEPRDVGGEGSQGGAFLRKASLQSIEGPLLLCQLRLDFMETPLVFGFAPHELLLSASEHFIIGRH